MMRLAMAVVLVAGCTKPAGSGGAFRVFFPDAGARGLRAKVGVRLQAKPAADCRNASGIEARWANTGARVAGGELPPGLVVEDGAIAGKPTQAGTWSVTVQYTGVTCGSEAVPDQQVPVTIIVSTAK